MIDCADSSLATTTERLQACAERVLEVASNRSLYLSMLAAPVMAGESERERRVVWRRLFEWHREGAEEGG
jgi:hypothetical protein